MSQFISISRSYPRNRMLILGFIVAMAASLSVLLITAFAQTGSTMISDPTTNVQSETHPSEALSIDSNMKAFSSSNRASFRTNKAADESAFSLAVQPETTLTVQILSPPWATLDSDHPEGGSGQIVPSAFVIEAVVTNTGPTTATWVDVNLDYNESIPGNWLLLNDEDPTRIIESLPSNEAAHLY